MIRVAAVAMMAVGVHASCEHLMTMMVQQDGQLMVGCLLSLPLAACTCTVLAPSHFQLVDL